jgi:hypothetical protein
MTVDRHVFEVTYFTVSINKYRELVLAKNFIIFQVLLASTIKVQKQEVSGLCRQRYPPSVPLFVTQ